MLRVPPVKVVVPALANIVMPSPPMLKTLPALDMVSAAVIVAPSPLMMPLMLLLPVVG